MRAPLIIRHAIIQAENGGKRFRRWMGAAKVLLLDGVPGSLVVVAAPIALAGPVNRLVHVPKPGGMNAVGCSQRGNVTRRQKQRAKHIAADENQGVKTH